MIAECPPKCSHEFCSNHTNRYKPCIQWETELASLSRLTCVIYFDRPSVTIPSCPDRCNTTYCSACYYSDTAVSTPHLCKKCKYPPTRICLFKWFICLRSYSILVSLAMCCMHTCVHKYMRMPNFLHASTQTHIYT